MHCSSAKRDRSESSIRKVEVKNYFTGVYSRNTPESRNSFFEMQLLFGVFHAGFSFQAVPLCCVPFSIGHFEIVSYYPRDRVYLK